MNIELQIDSIDLDGTEGIGPERMGESLERELARLIAERGLPAGLGGAALRVGECRLEVPPRASSEEVGARLARLLYERLAGLSGTAPAPGSRAGIPRSEDGRGTDASAADD